MGNKYDAVEKTLSEKSLDWIWKINMNFEDIHIWFLNMRVHSSVCVYGLAGENPQYLDYCLDIYFIN